MVGLRQVGRGVDGMPGDRVPGDESPSSGFRAMREDAGVSGGPLIVQSDKTLLLEVDHPDAQACRMAIAPFAELERSPSTCTRTGSRRWACGTPGPRQATTPRAWWTR
ncbi:hypothetical protein V2I01_16735 [Micromonospora sp. BRA006-A]|nr:hypothetical protein [Micromonospora sp. BRA006-A]